MARDGGPRGRRTGAQHRREQSHHAGARWRDKLSMDAYTSLCVNMPMDVYVELNVYAPRVSFREIIPVFE